jgi:hypothetical protein
MNTTDKKILYLPLEKEYFEQIKAGTKTSEFRKYKEFWINRLTNPDGSFKHYDLILFQNGYRKDAPQMLVEFKGIKINKNMAGFLRWEKEFEIALGKVEEIR